MGKYALPKEKQRPLKISEEDAIEQFMLFLSYYHIDLDLVAKRGSERTGQEITGDEMGDEYIRIIREGAMSIVEVDGKVVVKQHLYTPVGDFSEITYHEVNAQCRMRSDKAKQKGTTAATYEMCAALAGYPDTSLIEKFKSDDSAVTLQIGSLYFLL